MVIQDSFHYLRNLCAQDQSHRDLVVYGDFCGDNVRTHRVQISRGQMDARFNGQVEENNALGSLFASASKITNCYKSE